MEELAAAGIASLLHSSSSAATLQAPDLARALFPRAVWLRVAVMLEASRGPAFGSLLLDDVVVAASRNLLDGSALPAVLSLLALPRLPTTAWLAGEACGRAFGHPRQVVAAPVLGADGEALGAVLVGVPPQPLKQDLRLLTFRAEGLAKALAASGLAGRCAALVGDLRAYVLSGRPGAARRERDVLAMLLYHAINAAAFMHAADSRKRRAFTESGYAWVYASVCVLHTVLLAHPRLRHAGHAREAIMVTSHLLVVGGIASLVAPRFTAGLVPPQRRQYTWFLRGVLAEMQVNLTLLFPMRFAVTVPVRLACVAMAWSCVAEVCKTFQTMWASPAACVRGGAAALALVGFVAPVALTYVLELRSRELFMRGVHADARA